MGTPTVTNNQMELLAVLLGLQYADSAHYRIDRLVSDSQITLGRMFQGWSLKNIPDWMIELKDSVSTWGIKGEFVKGHNGDRWNELADKLCEIEALEYLRSSGLSKLIGLHTSPPWMKYKKRK